MSEPKRFEGGKPPIQFFIGQDEYHALGTLAADPFVELLTVIGGIATLSREAKATREATEARVAAVEQRLIEEGKTPDEAKAEATVEEGGALDVELLKQMKVRMADACDIALVPESASRMKRGLAGDLGGEAHVTLSRTQLEEALTLGVANDAELVATIDRLVPATTPAIEPVQFSTLQNVMTWLLDQHKLRQMPKDKDKGEGEGENEDGAGEDPDAVRPSQPAPDSATGSSTTGAGSEAS